MRLGSTEVAERPSVGLVVDHPQRDLPGLTLVAYRLWQAGVDVFLIPLNVLAAEAFSLAPDFLLVNYLRRNIEPVLRGCRESGIRYGVLDTEGGLYGDLSSYAGTFTTDRDLLDHVTVMCAWGRATSDFLCEQAILDEGQIVLCGVPRFDFYDARWRSFFDDPLIDDDRKLVLVNTKVAVANPQARSVAAEMRMLVGLGFPPEVIEDYRQVGVHTIRGILDLSNRLALEHPDLRFVIRPHPHERLATYEQGVDLSAANLAVIREGTVDRWIMRSTALIHRQCTTAVEAGFAGVPAIAPQWVPCVASAPDTELVSLRCDSYEELVEVLGAVVAGEEVVPVEVKHELARIEERWLHVMDGRANERVAQAVLDRLVHSVVDRAESKRCFFRGHERARSIQGAAGRLARLASTVAPPLPWTRLAHPATAGWRMTTKAFDARDVSACLDGIRRSLGDEVASARCIARPARDVGAYQWGYVGYSVALTAGDEPRAANALPEEELGR